MIFRSLTCVNSAFFTKLFRLNRFSYRLRELFTPFPPPIFLLPPGLIGNGCFVPSTLFQFDLFPFSIFLSVIINNKNWIFRCARGMIKMPSRDGRSEAALCPMDKKPDLRSICLFITEEAGLSPPKPCFLRCFPSPQPAGRDSPVTACLFPPPAPAAIPLLTNPRPVGIICSNQTAMKGKNAFVPLREPVVGANRRGGGADTGPGVARLRTAFQGGTAGPVTGCGLVGGRERPAETAGGTRVVPRKSLRP